MQEQKFHFLKKVRKIFFAVAGSVLLLFLLYDLTELLVVSCPGTIRVYSCGKAPLELPYKVWLKSRGVQWIDDPDNCQQIVNAMKNNGSRKPSIGVA